MHAQICTQIVVLFAYSTAIFIGEVGKYSSAYKNPLPLSSERDWAQLFPKSEINEKKV